MKAVRPVEAASTQQNEHGDAIEKLTQNEQFIAFCAEHGIDMECYRRAACIPRFVRVHPSRILHGHENQWKLLLREGNDNEYGQVDDKLLSSAKPLDWLPSRFGFFTLDPSVPLQTLPAYRRGELFGMDVASAIAVMALDPQSGDSILDLCCAPGAKLCFIADLISINQKHGPQGEDTPSNPAFELTGVDVSIRRLSTCRKLLSKYGVDNVRLILADGANFRIDEEKPLYFDPHLLKRRLKQFDIRIRKEREQAKDMNGDENIGNQSEVQLPAYVTNSGMLLYESGVFRQRRIQRMKDGPTSSKRCDNIPLVQFDKIIVDAECTTDGSMKHMLQLAVKNDNELERRIMDKQRMQTIVQLQKRLLKNGFSLLKPGGALVYSTCSLTRAQNEEVVQWLLDSCRNAKLVPALEADSVSRVPHRSGFIPHTVRFDPVSSGTSGLFVAKITRLS